MVVLVVVEAAMGMVGMEVAILILKLMILILKILVQVL